MSEIISADTRILVHVWERSRRDQDGRMMMGRIKATDELGIFTEYEGGQGGGASGWERDLEETELRRIRSLLRNTNPALIIMTDRQANKLPEHVRAMDKKGKKRMLTRSLPRVTLHRPGRPALRGTVVALDGSPPEQLVCILYHDAEHVTKQVFVEDDWSTVELAALGHEREEAATIKRQCTWINEAERTRAGLDDGTRGPPGTSPARLNLASRYGGLLDWGHDSNKFRQVSTRGTMSTRQQKPHPARQPTRRGLISRQLTAASRAHLVDDTELRAGGVSLGNREGRETALRAIHQGAQAARSTNPRGYRLLERHKAEAKRGAQVRNTGRDRQRHGRDTWTAGFAFLMITDRLDIKTVSNPHNLVSLSLGRKVTGITTGNRVILVTTSDGNLWSTGHGPTGRKRTSQQDELRQVVLPAEGKGKGGHPQRTQEPMGRIVDLIVFGTIGQGETVIASVEGREEHERMERIYTWKENEEPQKRRSTSARRVVGYGHGFNRKVAFITAAGEVTGLPQQKVENDDYSWTDTTCRFFPMLDAQARSLQVPSHFRFTRRSKDVRRPWAPQLINEPGMGPVINAVTHCAQLTILTISGELWQLHQSLPTNYWENDGAPHAYQDILEGTWMRADESGGPGEVAEAFHAASVQAEGDTMIATKRAQGEDRIFSAVTIHLPIDREQVQKNMREFESYRKPWAPGFAITMVDNNITLRGRQYNILRDNGGQPEGGDYSGFQQKHPTFLLTHHRGRDLTLYPMEQLRGTAAKPTRHHPAAAGTTAGQEIVFPELQTRSTEKGTARCTGDNRREGINMQPMEEILATAHMANMLGYLTEGDICALVCVSAHMIL